MRLDTLKQVVRAALESRHRGKDRAVKLADLAEILGATRKTVQAAIHELIFADRLPIGTSKTPPCGVYLIVDEDDRRAAADMLIHTAKSELARAAVLRRIPIASLVLQLQLDFTAPRFANSQFAEPQFDGPGAHDGLLSPEDLR